jgi:hypothetical protein
MVTRSLAGLLVAAIVCSGCGRDGANAAQVDAGWTGDDAAAEGGSDNDAARDGDAEGSGHGPDAGDAGHAGDAEGGATSTPAIRASSGWQVYDAPTGPEYHYGPSIIINADASIDMWTCSPGSNGAWDYVRYHHSTDGGHTWTPDVVALQPTPGSLDAYSTCDPGVVKVGSYYYVGYTSTTDSAGSNNDVFLARSTSPSGPFDKWNGAGWGGNPRPILTYTGNPSSYGYGEPALVLMGKKLYVYYSDDEATQYTNVATVDDATVDDWPAHLVDHGHAIARTRNAQDSADVVYVDSLGLFLAVTTYERFTSNASVAAYVSSDGLSFTPVPYFGARAQQGAHNVGISGDPSGHFDVKAANFVAYAYQPTGDGWGQWPTFLDPIQLTSSPLGTPVAGEVSSIVNGSDWTWSGPRAWDGDPTTIYSSNSHGPTATATEWAMVDTGATYALSGLTLVPRVGGYGFPVDFSIQTSADGNAWTDVPGQSHTGFPSPSAPVALTFGAPVSARYLRINATRLGADNLGNYYLQLAEIVPAVR